MDNKSDQKNPNNERFYKSRGQKSRPSNWKEEILKTIREGQLEYQANTIASKTDRPAMGRDIVRIEKVVKNVLGGNVFVYKGGSVKKHTNIEGSDLDLKIDVFEPLKEKERNALTEALKIEFGEHNVDVKTIVHKIQGESGSIDLLPQKATYISSATRVDKLGKEPFKTNPIGRNAVRLLKEKFKVADVPGIYIERAVLQTQNMERGITLENLITKTNKLVYELLCGSIVETMANYKNHRAIVHMMRILKNFILQDFQNVNTQNASEMSGRMNGNEKCLYILATLPYEKPSFDAGPKAQKWARKLIKEKRCKSTLT